ncbi:hypothetical protein F4803DRAFT_542371 [Xylaria telfairii]|nr:hypothetical protein F4803DRAFT_542371 [Xylaria telfairii]
MLHWLQVLYAVIAYWMQPHVYAHPSRHSLDEPKCAAGNAPTRRQQDYIQGNVLISLVVNRYHRVPGSFSVSVLCSKCVYLFCASKEMPNRNCLLAHRTPEFNAELRKPPLTAELLMLSPHACSLGNPFRASETRDCIYR